MPGTYHMSIIITIAAIIMRLSDPEAATRFAAQVFAPGLEAELVAICRRESRCKRAVSVHRGDAMHHGKVWRRAVARGWLDPECQSKDEGWSTRGNHGLMAGYHLRYLGPVPCLPARVLDVPLVSAIAAARKAQALCQDRGACTAAALRDYWHGRGFSRGSGGTAGGNAPGAVLSRKVRTLPLRVGRTQGRRLGPRWENLVQLDKTDHAPTAQRASEQDCAIGALEVCDG